jgi:hypothetical protein
MATRKTNKAAHRNRVVANGRGSKGHGAMKLVRASLVPLAATAGFGLLAATGVILRKQLLQMAEGALHSAASQGKALGKNVSFERMLSLAGLQRKRSFMNMTLPGLGGLVVGLAAGSALAIFLGPRLTGGNGLRTAADSDTGKSVTHDGVNETSAEPASWVEVP